MPPIRNFEECIKHQAFITNKYKREALMIKLKEERLTVKDIKAPANLDILDYIYDNGSEGSTDVTKMNKNKSIGSI